MIIPKKQRETEKSIFSVLFTVLFCLAAYLILANASVPDPDTTQMQMRQITQINLTRFVPAEEDPIVEEPVQEEEPSAEDPVEEIVMEEAEALARVDIRDILPEGFRLAEPEARVPDTRTAEQREDLGGLAMRETESSLSADMRRSFSGGDLSALAPRRSADLDADAGLGIASGTGIIIGRTGLSDDEGAGSLLGDIRARDIDTVSTVVGLRRLEEFGEDYEDIETLFFPLAEWMKRNPAHLPSAVRRLMGDGRWDDSFLTSRTSFRIGDRVYELLLMSKEELKEVHIFLVQDRTAIYLIDRGFQKDSNFLRVGQVGFRNNEIAEIDSEMRDAGRQYTEQFYQIFLSWWNSVEL